ncbi:MAG: glycosyltransferase family 4 protein [Vitreoscilla sp.]|nr:glycosyltransferase family 4 protein [Burkholderiales bacterium]MBP6336863.1 glycosyltransferase family 4 protein [Vitreoscilla sp.]MBP6674669.1 glycosyltransferase family 4 protein [Vitreoscilla sp.]
MNTLPHKVLPLRPRPRLLIQGWRGVHHSFAMVNQHQILALARHGGFELHHHDVAFLMPHWNASNLDAGFDAQRQSLIASLSDLPLEQADAVLRVAAPLAAPSPASPPALTFAVTEFGLDAKGFAQPEAALSDWTCGEHRLVTPSRWSRDRLLDFGFEEQRVHVVPHGVDGEAFSPSSAPERDANRAVLGLGEGTVAFLNVGVPTWNKGLDLLVRAFARVHLAYPDTRLVLKDARALYGLSVEQVLRDAAATDPAVREPAFLGAITVLPTSLTQAQLRALYGAVDCYVSPYRAEGFNLPVLEALACATPVVVSSGGATDDFCHGAGVSRIASVFHRGDLGNKSNCCWVEPQIDALVALMAEAASAGPNRPETRSAQRSGARANALAHPWDRAADALARLLRPAAGATTSAPASAQAFATALPDLAGAHSI